jgi:hypothetical protein
MIDHPDHGEKEDDSPDERHAEAELAAETLLVFRQSRAKDGQENDVVDPEHDFKQGERQQAHPDFDARKVKKDLFHDGDCVLARGGVSKGIEKNWIVLSFAAQ